MIISMTTFITLKITNKYKGESNKDHEPSKEKEFIKLIKERYSVKLLEETL